MSNLIHIVSSGSAKRTIEVIGTTTIGRDDDNDIVLDDQHVSGCHALLITQAGGLCLIDLDSTSGTYVNETLVPPDQHIRLKDGDLIRLGPAMLYYVRR